jgi:hypothetical protein
MTNKYQRGNPKPLIEEQAIQWPKRDQAVN